MQNSKPCALVTGASSGIGAAFAKRLAAAGYDLILVARRVDRLQALAGECESAHPIRARVLQADLTTDDGIDAVARACADATALRMVVNNAGFGGYKPFAELSRPEIDALVNIHVRAVAAITHAGVAAMLKREGGAILNIASLLALSGSLAPDPLPYRAVYAGAKSFIVVFSRALAKELEKTSVSVHVCLPGVVETEFHGGRSLGPAMSAEDVVTAAMASIERRETVCVPALGDAALLETLFSTERAIFAFARTPGLAVRYQ